MTRCTECGGVFPETHITEGVGYGQAVCIYCLDVLDDDTELLEAER